MTAGQVLSLLQDGEEVKHSVECKREKAASVCWRSLAMSEGFVSEQYFSAYDPLPPLQTWISYTHAEIIKIIKVKEDLKSYRQEFATTQQIQQGQLDVIQSQLRKHDHKTSELIDATTELIVATIELLQKQRQTQDILSYLLGDLSSRVRVIPVVLWIWIV